MRQTSHCCLHHEDMKLREKCQCGIIFMNSFNKNKCLTESQQPGTLSSKLLKQQQGQQVLQEGSYYEDRKLPNQLKYRSLTSRNICLLKLSLARILKTIQGCKRLRVRQCDMLDKRLPSDMKRQHRQALAQDLRPVSKHFEIE